MIHRNQVSPVEGQWPPKMHQPLPQDRSSRLVLPEIDRTEMEAQDQTRDEPEQQGESPVRPARSDPASGGWLSRGGRVSFRAGVQTRLIMSDHAPDEGGRERRVSSRND